MVGQNKPVQSPLLVAAARFRKRASQRGTNQRFPLYEGKRWKPWFQLNLFSLPAFHWL